MYLAIFGFVLGCGFLILAYKYFDAKLHMRGFILATAACVLFLCYLPSVQGFLKTGVITRLIAKMDEYGAKLDEFQTTTVKMSGEIGTLQSQLKTNQFELEQTQSKIRTAQVENAAQQITITNQVQKIGVMQKELEVAQNQIVEQQAKIADQQKQIESVEFLVNNLFSKTALEEIRATDAGKMLIIARTNSEVSDIVFRLNHVPIPNSIRIVAQTPTTQIPILPVVDRAQTNNVFWLVWRGEDPKSFLYSIQYVRDMRATNIFRELLLKKDGVYVGDFGPAR